MLTRRDARFSCANFDSTTGVDYAAIAHTVNTTGGIVAVERDDLEMLFFWNPLAAYDVKWCHIDLCIANGGTAPAGSRCACPPTSKLNVMYTGLFGVVCIVGLCDFDFPLFFSFEKYHNKQIFSGARLRLNFLRDLMRERKVHYVVTTPPMGALDNEFHDSLRLVPTAIVSYNFNGAIHWCVFKRIIFHV